MSASFTVARSAYTFVVFGYAGVVFVVFVSFGAVCFASFGVVLAFRVFAGGYGFEVVWVAAFTVTA
jgi:hypothetical protein